MPLHKRGRKYGKQNNKPVSILPTLSKIYERNIFKQMSPFLKVYFLVRNTVFQRYWKSVVDKNENFCAPPISLSKAYDRFNYKNSYCEAKRKRFTFTALKLIHNYLPSKK